MTTPIDKPSEGLGPDNDARKELEQSPAFNPSTLLNHRRIGLAGTVGKTIEKVHTGAHAILHPKAALKSRATRATAGRIIKDSPYLSRELDLEFLAAHDDMREAQAVVDKCNATRDDESDAVNGEKETEQLRDKEWRVEELEEKRRAMKVGYITDRHVHHVKVIPDRPVGFLANGSFTSNDENGYAGVALGRWLARVRWLFDCRHADCIRCT